jgi:hypothetical protein
MVKMAVLAAQYLESVPSGFGVQDARDCLQHAFDILPISYILLGWSVPLDIEAAVAEETARRGARLYQWHPLLTGEGDTPLAWRTLSLHGKHIPGHNHLPEFTFLCPNHPAAQEYIAERIEKVIQSGIYQGIFLDRIRYPSPAASPEDFLGCFCDHCRRAAVIAGFDLDSVRRQIIRMPAEKDRRISLIQSLFAHNPQPDSALETYLRFRADSVTRCVASISSQIQASGMETSLDCFSPSLAWMVGQDLEALDKVSLWTKVMTYPHTYGPAGLPFELLGLLDWLQKWDTGNELEILRECSGLDLPHEREILASTGLPSKTIQQEIETGKFKGVKNLLAGLALVDIPGINRVDSDDLEANKEADGIVLSWDLRLISPETLRRLSTDSVFTHI